jgi:transcriptional regulator with PAS, ATPase and Fis domain
VQRRYAFDSLIGSSPAIQRVFEVMEKVATTDATVLLTGETGTGKDLVARAIHYAGVRKSGRFVAQNCGALPDTLLESELFGHKRGAFTGAHEDKKGLFELAHNGTIFLDEIGETNPGMQVRLLRVLQDGEVRPLGASDVRKVDVRVIAATNRDLRRWCRKASSAASTTGCASSRSTSRRCASAARTSPSSPTTSSKTPTSA